MALFKYKCSSRTSSASMAPSSSVIKMSDKIDRATQGIRAGVSAEHDVDIDIREVYFLIVQFLSLGPCKRSCGLLVDELLQHHLLPRRYHAHYSRYAEENKDLNNDGFSVEVSYSHLVERFPHIERDHLVKLLKQLLLDSSRMSVRSFPSAADISTLLGPGSFSLLSSDRHSDCKEMYCIPSYLRWPHTRADQIRGLSLREIGGGFTRHHRAPSVRAACYAIAKPSTLVQKMQIIQKSRGHQNAVYCATFDRSGRFVITGSDDRLVKIWSMETAFCLASCRGHEGDITDLAVNTTNILVASSSNDFTIRVWRIPDGQPVSVLKGHNAGVTAIAFSPRPSAVYQLLSSSDDGTCRMWDARCSQQSLRLYVPKTPEAAGGRNGETTAQLTRRILCCAFNANGTVFVTGSSDTYARVWSAFRSSDESEQQIHELDLLSGHEDDVNYVQFSGCAVPSRTMAADIFKEDNPPKFKNSWFTHDNIVTCSRDGSAIIWGRGSRRSHSKVCRWTRAYHLKVPPPPMPLQPIRGGPRQRAQQTPRGVNMIVWSLDNRFVLAAIMDCRICVWNASDGSLVHSLMGHKESTFVLDVHPFNPRIAMSAGYDGKTIIWDIWEGTPVQIYEIGQYKLVDGKFSPDGTSIILSDEVGQIFFIATGQGESQKDAKYDQFYLGDYRSLMQDTSGNVLDQETQLPPYRRNMQDLLCDSSMIPYPEPYQSMFQRRRLGILGIEWRPPSINFTVGPTFNMNTGEYQLVPVIDLDIWAEPFPEVMDVIDFDQDNDVQSDDTDSEYNVNDENSTGGEQEVLSGSFSSDTEGGSLEISDEGDHDVGAAWRRSKRKKTTLEDGIITSSGRRVKKRNLDEPEERIKSKVLKVRKNRNGRSVSKPKSSKTRGLRPQRRAARNALDFFSKINGGLSDTADESEGESENDSSEYESEEYEKFMEHSNGMESGSVLKSSPTIGGPSNSGSRTKFILRLPRSVLSAALPQPNGVECPKPELEPSTNLDDAVINAVPLHEKYGLVSETDGAREGPLMNSDLPITSADFGRENIHWGGKSQRTVKRPKFAEFSANDMCIFYNATQDACLEDGDPNENPDCIDYATSLGAGNGSHQIEGESARSTNFVMGGANRTCLDQSLASIMLPETETMPNAEHFRDSFENTVSMQDLPASQNISSTGNFSMDEKVENGHRPVSRKLRIRSKGLEQSAVADVHHPDISASNHENGVHCSPLQQRYQDEGTSQRTPRHVDVSLKPENIGTWIDTKVTSNEYKNKRACTDKMFDVVYTRSKPQRARKNSCRDIVDDSTSISNQSDPAGDESSEWSKSRGMGVAPTEVLPTRSSSRVRRNYGCMEASTSGRSNGDSGGSFLKEAIGLRSRRNRREIGRSLDARLLEGRKSWLMLDSHEVSCRYIPQLGDKVVYLRQGHEKYIKESSLDKPSSRGNPRMFIKGLKAAEVCEIHELEYSTCTGSGESCCKLTLKFVDSASSAFGETLNITYNDLVDSPDFLVEKAWYDASLERDWSLRDKCRVWWRNADGGGEFWNGRITAVRPYSQEFPDSPWERFVVKYIKGGSEDNTHCPWELHDPINQWEHPHIDSTTRDNLLSRISRLEKTSSSNEDYYGVHKLNQAVEISNFINKFPVQFSINTIKSRLQNDYYRTLEALRHDASVMLMYAKIYFTKDGKMSKKLARLSTWIDTKLFS